ncbi:hypothetical protein RI444_15505 [Paenarthrobacter sp. AT5]|uniref:hypothetical protein n=1 Tax=Paenarthrobacter TaxID=1742992 RepID=UPI001A992CCC|nr:MULTISPECIES: hypothetical protein [Paenarthrobacter]QSZ53261.1 hypothetical protein AYX19_09765 [Paenarthrobacter ureafaciens]WOC59914.1 hypothetical protein RI444_15505 [Paenarthrobacter sp. AT5]
MADYTFESELVADPYSFDRAANASITVYDVADENETTPLALKDMQGLPLANPLTSSAEAFVPAFIAPSPEVKMVGGGLRVPRASFKGVREEAAALKVAAQEAAADAAESALNAQAPTDAQVDAGIARANIPAHVAAVVPDAVLASAQTQVPPLVAAALADEPAVTGAAAALAQSDAGLVRTQDSRLLDSGDVPGVLFGVVGSDDKQTALMLGLDGELTPTAAARVGKSLGVQDIALDSGEQYVVVNEKDQVIFSDVTAQAGATSAFPVADWAHWGDSMTDNAVTGANAWVTKLAALTGRNHFNGGWYQQTAAQISARQGGQPSIVTVAGNVTSGTGPTTVTSIVNKPVLPDGVRSVPGTLAGVRGILKEPTDGNVQFTPDILGVYPIQAKSVFTPTNGKNYRDRTVTIWSGRNDVTYTTPITLVLASIRAAIDYLSPNVKRVIVMEVVPAQWDNAGQKAYLAALNAAIKAAFPEFWLDIATWLRTPAAAAAAGIAFTAEDNTDIENGLTPTSFRIDSTHINAAGCTAVAARVYQEAQNRGWL